MSKKDKIRELLDEGIAPKDIAEKVDCKVQTVYHYRHLLKKEEEPTKKSPVKNEDKPKKQAADRESDKLKRENKALKAELLAVEKDHEKQETVIANLEQMNKREKELTKQTIQKCNKIYKEKIALEEELEQLQEESKRKDTEITLHKQDKKWVERNYNDANKSLVNLQERNDELRAEAEKQIDRLQAELDAERAKHEHLSSYAVILMQKEVTHAQ